MLRSTLTLLALVSTLAAAEPPATHAPNATLDPSDLVEFAKQPPRVQELLTQALALTKLNLIYAYGSADPSNGGMDCSGTMYFLLRNAGFKDIPRDSSSQYAWARKAGGFRAVVSKSAKSFEFDELLPGDLLFWSGTYETSREIPISHVMLYLGTEKKRKTRVMFGASDGRSYDGAQRWGVSVFDFVMPRINPTDPAKAKVDFVGYARIPTLRDPNALVAATEPIPEADTPANPKTDSDSTKTESDTYTSKKPKSKSAASSKSKSPTAQSDTPSSMHKKSSGSPQSAISNEQSAMPTDPPAMHKKSASQSAISNKQSAMPTPPVPKKSSTPEDAQTGGFKPRKSAEPTPSPKKKKKSS